LYSFPEGIRTNFRQYPWQRKHHKPDRQQPPIHPPLAPREDEKAKKGANQQPPKASLLLLLEKEKEVAFDHHLSTLPIHDHENDPHERGGTTLLDRTDLEMYNAPTFRAAQQCHCRDNNQTLESP